MRLVKSVTLTITDENGTLLEQGPASTVDSLEWTYTTKAAATGSHPTVQAIALDLPGHSFKMDKMK